MGFFVLSESYADVKAVALGGKGGADEQVKVTQKTNADAGFAGTDKHQVSDLFGRFPREAGFWIYTCSGFVNTRHSGRGIGIKCNYITSG